MVCSDPLVATFCVNPHCVLTELRRMYIDVTAESGPSVSREEEGILLLIIQGGARNVIPLIVHVTHFYYYKNI